MGRLAIDNVESANKKPNTKKDWTIWDSQTKQIVELTHEQFQEGLEKNYVKLRGEFLKLDNNDKIWIDGIMNNY